MLCGRPPTLQMNRTQLTNWDFLPLTVKDGEQKTVKCPFKTTVSDITVSPLRRHTFPISPPKQVNKND